MKYFSDDNNIWLASYGIEAKLGDIYKLFNIQNLYILAIAILKPKISYQPLLQLQMARKGLFSIKLIWAIVIEIPTR